MYVVGVLGVTTLCLYIRQFTHLTHGRKQISVIKILLKKHLYRDEIFETIYYVLCIYFFSL